MVVSLVTKPSFRPVQGLSVVLVVLIFIQILLGFATLGSGSPALAWVHFLVAMAIYGAAIAGTFMAFRWNQMVRSPQAKEAQKEG
jgi:heme A synthase